MPTHMSVLLIRMLGLRKAVCFVKSNKCVSNTYVCFDIIFINIQHVFKFLLCEFNKVFEYDPLNEEAYLGLSDAYISLGQNENAIETLKAGFEEIVVFSQNRFAVFLRHYRFGQARLKRRLLQNMPQRIS